MNKIILDLCGGTGAWSDPYRKAGYDVRNITLPEFDITQTGFTINAILFKDSERNRPMENPSNYIEFSKVYGILAAPPCTMFSFARTLAKKPRDLKAGMELVIACLNIIWECRYKNNLAFWALENPMGYLRQFLGKPAFTFDPCEFGDGYTKRTDLWGYFNKPLKIKIPKNKKFPSISDFTGSGQSIRRAITPPKFAKAFFRANQ